MMQMLKSVARVACTRTACIAQRSPITVAPIRHFVAPTIRSFGAPKGGIGVSTNIDEDGIPSDLPIRVDHDGVRWADYRPENLRNIQAVRNADGDLVGKFEGEEVIFPDLEPTLEWVLTTPVDLHLFEESPIIKMYLEETGDVKKY